MEPSHVRLRMLTGPSAITSCAKACTGDAQSFISSLNKPFAKILATQMLWAFHPLCASAHLFKMGIKVPQDCSERITFEVLRNPPLAVTEMLSGKVIKKKLTA